MKIKLNFLLIVLLVFYRTILISQQQKFKMVIPELNTMMENNVVSSTETLITIEDDQISRNRVDDERFSTEYAQVEHTDAPQGAEIIKSTSMKDVPSREITATTEAQIILSNNQTARTTSDCFRAIDDEKILEREIEKVLHKIQSKLNNSSFTGPVPPKRTPTMIKWNIYFTLNINVSNQNSSHTDSDSDSFDSGTDILVNGSNETETMTTEQAPNRAETVSTPIVDNRRPKNALPPTPIILWICLILLQLEIFLIVGGFISLTFKSQRKWLASLSNRNLLDSGVAIPIGRFPSLDSFKHHQTTGHQPLPPEIFQQIELNIERNVRSNRFSSTPNKSTRGSSDSNSYWQWARPSTPTNQKRRGNNHLHNRMGDRMMINHECKL